jgi:hypothetical protein
MPWSRSSYSVSKFAKYFIYKAKQLLEKSNGAYHKDVGLGVTGVDKGVQHLRNGLFYSMIIQVALRLLLGSAQLFY